MYKQNQGLMAKGTVGTQATGGTLAPKKKSYSLQSAQGDFQLGGVGGALSSIGKGVGSFVDTLGRAGVLGGQSRGNLFTYTPGAFAGTQPRPQAPEATQPATQTPARAISQPEIMDLINSGYIYTARGMSDEGLMRARDKMMADRAGAQGRMSAAPVRQQQAPETITPEFRMPITSPYAKLVNPYGTDYRTGMMARVSGQTARQFAPQREQLEASLAARGISRESPLFQSMMAQQQAAESGARLQAVSAAEEAGLQAAANWEMQRAQGEAGYQQTLQDVANRLARQPGELAQLEAASRLTTAQADIASIDALIKADPEVKAATKRKVLAESGMSDVEYQAAMNLLERMDPNKWWNHPAWGIVGGVVDNALKISQAFKNLTTAGR